MPSVWPIAFFRWEIVVGLDAKQSYVWSSLIFCPQLCADGTVQDSPDRCPGICPALHTCGACVSHGRGANLTDWEPRRSVHIKACSWCVKEAKCQTRSGQLCLCSDLGYKKVYSSNTEPGIRRGNEDSHGNENQKSREKNIFRGEKNWQAYFFLWKWRWWICECKLKVQNLHSSWILVC